MADVTAPELAPRAEFLLDLALDSGAEAVEVYVSSSLSHPVAFEANRLKQLETIESTGIGLRLWRNGKPGLVTAYGDYDPQVLIDQALSLSDLNNPEVIYLQKEQQQSQRLHDSHSGSLNPSDLSRFVDDGARIRAMIEWGESAIDKILEQFPEAICSASWDYTYEKMRLINSYGLDYSYSDTSFSGSIGAEWIRGDDFLSVWESDVARNQLLPETMLQRLLRSLYWAKENVDSPQGHLPVLITSKAADLLWGVVANAMNGKQVQQKTTPWLHQLGQSVIADCWTLRQDPELGIYGTPFDDEGTITHAFDWINQGKLQGFYGDLRTSQENPQLGIQSQGNGFRGDLGTYPQPGLFNLIVEATPTSEDLESLAAMMEHGIIVDQLMGNGATIAGDFAMNIELGYRVEHGEIVGRIKDSMLAGNAYQALNQVIGIGGDRQWQGSLYVPSVIVDGLTVTARGDDETTDEDR
ncbi:MAG: TldD/PmbA family protein [Pseudanabaenaceae cyanobacterium]